jgi:hypothetical protein
MSGAAWGRFFLPALDGMMTSGLVTLEKIQVRQYGPNNK